MRAYVSSVALLTALGCGGSLPQPLQSAPLEASFVEVPYPPPPALSELVPPKPREPGAVYLDGSWAWRGNYYVWQRGGWVKPPPGVRATPWSLRYAPDGRAFFAKNGWVNERGERARPPRILVPSVTPPNEVTAEFQTGR